MRRNIWMPVYLILALGGCKESSFDQDMLPPGRGKPGEILMVIDSAKWNSPVGDALRITFNEPLSGLPRDESQFDLRHVAPFDFKTILKQARNLVLLVPLYDHSSEGKRMQSFFDKKSIDSLQSNSSLFLINKSNLFAKDQQVLFIIGHNEGELPGKIAENTDIIRKFFNDSEEKRAMRSLFQIKEEKLISNQLKSERHFDIRVPYSFKLAENREGFIWLRLPGQEIDKSIVIAYQPYQDTLQFHPDSILSWRNRIFKYNIYGDPANPETFVKTETLVPPILKKMSFGGKYAVNLRGLWRTNNISMGGPFIGYSLVDQELNRQYYIEAFLYSPGVEQRELMRELDVVLKTFRTSDMK
jgi:hypothetical protein